MSTIKDVARRAGVSITLVSRYINGKKGVGAQTAERIREAIDELGYQPNTLARSLVQGRSRAIAVLLDALDNPSYNAFIRNVATHIHAAGYKALFLSGETPELKHAYFNEFSLGPVDGIIVCGMLDPSKITLSASGRVVTLVDNQIPELQADCVLFDNRQAAYLLTQHMLRGARWVCFFSGDKRLFPCQEREAGYRQAIEELQGADHVHVVESGMERADGYETMKRLLGKGLCPEGILCCTDEAGMGAMEALLEAGKRVPQHVLVAGFGGSQEVTDPRLPALTTVGMPLEEMAQEAVELLLARIEDPKRPYQRREHMPRMLLRRSTRS